MQQKRENLLNQHTTRMHSGTHIGSISNLANMLKSPGQ